METIRLEPKAHEEIKLLRFALALVDANIDRLRSRKLKSYEEFAKLHDERQVLTRRITQVILDHGGRVPHDKDVYYAISNTCHVLIPALCGWEWKA